MYLTPVEIPLKMQHFQHPGNFFSRSNDTFFKLLIAIKRKGYLAASSLSGKAVGKILSEVEHRRGQLNTTNGTLFLLSNNLDFSGL